MVPLMLEIKFVYFTSLKYGDLKEVLCKITCGNNAVFCRNESVHKLQIDY